MSKAKSIFKKKSLPENLFPDIFLTEGLKKFAVFKTKEKKGILQRFVRINWNGESVQGEIQRTLRGF